MWRRRERERERRRERESRKEEVTTAKKMRGSNAHATYTEEK